MRAEEFYRKVYDSADHKPFIDLLFAEAYAEQEIKRLETTLLVLTVDCQQEIKELKECNHPLDKMASVKSHGKNFCWKCGEHIKP